MLHPVVDYFGMINAKQRNISPTFDFFPPFSLNFTTTLSFRPGIRKFYSNFPVVHRIGSILSIRQPSRNSKIVALGADEEE